MLRCLLYGRHNVVLCTSSTQVDADDQKGQKSQKGKKASAEGQSAPREVTCGLLGVIPYSFHYNFLYLKNICNYSEGAYLWLFDFIVASFQTVTLISFMTFKQLVIIPLLKKP